MNRQIKRKILAVTLIAALSMNTMAFADTTKSVSVNYGGSALLVNGKTVSMKDSNNKNIEAITYNKVVYAPIKAMAEALGLTLSYDTKAKVVTLTTKTKTAESASKTSEGATGVSQGSIPLAGSFPMGTPPNGTPPTGTPPEGTPPTGTPPSGAYPVDAKSSATTSSTKTITANTSATASGVTGTTKATAGTSGKTTAVAVSVTKAVTKKLSLIFSGVTVKLDGKLTAFKDASGNTIEPFTYGGTIYVPVKAFATAVGVTLTEDTAKGLIYLTSKMNIPAGMPTGGTESAVTGTGVLTVSTNQGTLTGQTVSATLANESGIKVTKGGILTLADSAVSKTGDSTAVETSNFTGLNAGVLAENGAVLSLENVTVNTNAEGSNAVVSTGNGTKVTIDGLTVNTTEDSSRGIHATYQGVITASNINISTKGAHSGAITTDRGEGTVTVNTGTVATEGEGSPGIYSTGNITATHLNSTASGSEAAVIEGRNSITLIDSILYGAKKWGVMIYQSFSGDAGTGTGTFTMTGGALTAATGPLFYSTNTSGVIQLKAVTLKNDSGVLLLADGNNQWGTKGSNGANIVFTADTQNLSGSVNVDAISTVAMTLKNNSTFNGSLNNAKTAKLMAITLDTSSIWTLSADSYVSVISDEDTSLSNIVSNGHNIYYDSSNAKNSWLEGKTISLSGGGVLAPVSK